MAVDVVFRRGTHVSGTDPRFDPEEQLASAVADFGRVLAKMKCPSNYLSGLIKQGYKWAMMLFAIEVHI